MARQYPELIWGDQMFPRLLPWAMERQQYLPDEVHQFCTVAYQIDEAKQHLLFRSGRPAWHNHVEHALRLMTKPLQLHLRPSENDGVHYKPDHARIRAYLLEHPSAQEDNLLVDPHAEFIAATKDMPQDTEVQRLEVKRIGQDIFRRALIRVWNRCCPVTGIDNLSLLRASHIKRWEACESSHERLDENNGLLLAASIDAAFDVGLISFSEGGEILLSSTLTGNNTKRLGVGGNVVIPMSVKREVFMKWHRQRFGFETGRSPADPERPIIFRSGHLFR